MKPGFNPTRRNRNIGTVKQGYGSDNRLVIPCICSSGRSWKEQLGPHQNIQRLIAGREVVFLVEETNGACAHACTVEDIRHILMHVPVSDWEGLDTFVLRQSTRKQRLIRPAWGRMFYSADLGRPGRNTTRIGPTVMLEAIDFSSKLKWSAKLTPSDLAELERLRGDGHPIRREGHYFAFTMTPAAVRATQLYRTLLHEIGHWVDYLEKVARPSKSGADFDTLSTAYFARPRQEREAFAHRYADAMRARLTNFGILPFEPMTGVDPGKW